jgi:fibrillarin-like rRNA methylase
MGLTDNRCAKQMAQNFGLGATLGATVGECMASMHAVEWREWQLIDCMRAHNAGAAYGTWDAFKFKVCNSCIYSGRVAGTGLLGS